MFNFDSFGKKQSRERGSDCTIRFRFSAQYGVKSLVLFTVLTLIALYLRDSFIRPSLGDVLVVIWLYYLFATVVCVPVKNLIIFVILVAYGVELAQYLQLNQLLGIEQSHVLHIVLGATFDWKDLIAYTVGGFLCWLLERI